MPFVIRVAISACNPFISGVALNGTNIDVTIGQGPGGCVATPPVITLESAAGPFPAGTYTIRVLAFDAVLATAPLTITTDVPALDPRLLAILALALIVVAFVRLGAR